MENLTWVLRISTFKSQSNLGTVSGHLNLGATLGYHHFPISVNIAQPTYGTARIIWAWLTSAPDISAQIFYHGEILACVTFSSSDIPAHGHFISMDISARGIFGTGTFWHNEFLAPGHISAGIFRHHECFNTGTLWYWVISAHGYLGTVGILASDPKYLCRNVHIAVQGA